MTQPDELPPWLLAHVQKCRDAFGLADWPITLALVDCVADTPGYRALTTTDTRSLWAHVDIRRDIRRDQEGYRTLTHELLHAATYEQDRALRRIYSLIPRKQRQLAEDLWRDANENTIERLARALTPLIQAMDYQETSETESLDNG